MDVVVRKNGSAANVKVFKAGVTTLPATFSVTSAELATLFGAPVALGDTYDFAPNIYVGDRMFEAFPATGYRYWCRCRLLCLVLVNLAVLQLSVHMIQLSTRETL